MTSATSYTTETTSDITDKLQEAVMKAKTGLNKERLENLEKAKTQLDSLREKGLLKTQTYSMPSKDQIARQYMKSKI